MTAFLVEVIVSDLAQLRFQCLSFRPLGWGVGKRKGVESPWKGGWISLHPDGPFFSAFYKRES